MNTPIVWLVIIFNLNQEAAWDTVSIGSIKALTIGSIRHARNWINAKKRL
jgi:hypothetical protein